MSGPAPALSDPRPVGVFDSGVGGLSVWREIARQLPAEPTIYIADQAHIPYGPKPGDTLRAYAQGIVERLLAEGCKAIVVACNSASAAALSFLRQRYPDVPFVGMEPAVKPAAQATRSGVVAVLATPATLGGELYRTTAERWAERVQLIGEPCPGLVQQIEDGASNAPETLAMLRGFLGKAMNQNADHVVLACTHYPFVIEAIRSIVGRDISVIDPAPAVARQLARLLDTHGLRALSDAPGHARFCTSGDTAQLQRALQSLLGLQAPVEAMHWSDDTHLTTADLAA